MTSTARVRVRPPPNADFVLGYPGIDASWPRIVGVIELRPQAVGQTFKLKSLKLQLVLTESIHRDKKGIRRTVVEQKFMVGSPLLLYRAHPTDAGSFHAIDLPFVYTLPLSTVSTLPSSFRIDNHAQVIYTLHAQVVDWGTETKARDAATCPVTILRYDKIRLFRSLLRPISQTQSAYSGSNAEVARATLTVEHSSFGPGDPINLWLSVSRTESGSSARSIRVQEISAKLIQETKMKTVEGVVSEFETIAKAPKETSNVKLGDAEFIKHLTLRRLKPWRASETTNLVPRTHAGVPLSLAAAVDVKANLIIVNFYISVDIKMSGCKDIKVETAVSMTHFDKDIVADLKTAIDSAINEAHETGSDPLALNRQPHGIFILDGEDEMSLLLKTGLVRSVTGATCVALE